MKAETNLQKILARGEFAVTCEYNPPRGIDVDSIRQNAAQLKGKVDAVNVNDNTNATVRMSSWALSRILLDEGIEPVLQMVTRDRNRIALQSDLLGASALGIQNVLCLTGDHPSKGDHPEAKGVFDLDAVQWITAAKQRLRIAYGHTSHGSQIVSGLDALRFLALTVDSNSTSTPGRPMNTDLAALRTWRQASLSSR